jgi:hypothetical protein
LPQATLTLYRNGNRLVNRFFRTLLFDFIPVLLEKSEFSDSIFLWKKNNIFVQNVAVPIMNMISSKQPVEILQGYLMCRTNGL